jgi:hypothetical protein
MNKTDLLFQMLDNPDQYSEAQWQDILADEECRELYTLMAKTKSAAQSSQITDDEIDAEWQCLVHSRQNHATVIPLWRKIVAASAIMIALFGITYAAVLTGFFGIEKIINIKETSHKEEVVPTEEKEPAIQEISQVAGESTKEAPVKTEPRLYDNVPLEQILTELSAYYHVDVEYCSEDVRSLRLYYQWEPEYSLDKVIEMLSHFETFNIHREGDKLIVESSCKVSAVPSLLEQCRTAADVARSESSSQEGMQ